MSSKRLRIMPLAVIPNSVSAAKLLAKRAAVTFALSDIMGR